MANTFLTQAERNRYNEIPDLEGEDLHECFYLTDKNLEFISTFHGAVNRLAEPLFCLTWIF